MVLCAEVIIKDYHVPVSQQLKYWPLMMRELGVGVGGTCDYEPDSLKRAQLNIEPGSVQGWQVGRMHVCTPTHVLKKKKKDRCHWAQIRGKARDREDAKRGS